MARTGGKRQVGRVMQFPENPNDGAGTANDVAGGNGTDEPLFGDARWMTERLEALQSQGAPALRADGD